MPLIPAAMKSFITLKASSKQVAGSKFPLLAASIASAASQYIISVSTVTSTNNALGPGSGTQTGRVSGLNAGRMSNSMRIKANATGLSGRDLTKLLDSVAFGVVNSMKTVLLQGTIIGAGPGTGTGKILGLSSSALKKIIRSQTSLRQISGDKLDALAGAISSGITSHILSSGRVSVTNIGAAAGPPAGPVTIPAAPGTGRLV